MTTKKQNGNGSAEKKKKSVIIVNGAVKPKKKTPSAKKERTPDKKPVAMKKAAMRSDKDVCIEVLQSIFAEYQRETYFCTGKKKPVLVLHYIRTKKDGEECHDEIPVTVKLIESSMQNIRVTSPEKPGTETVTTIWNLIRDAADNEDYQIAYYEYTE